MFGEIAGFVLTLNWAGVRPLAKAKDKTLPEAQRTQGIDSLTWVISPAK